MQDLNDFLAGKRKTLPPNSVVVTIDDGWKCTYTEIFPEMKRHRFPFTVFLYPKFIGQSNYALSWKQVREMSADGVDIESHSLSHPFLTQRRHRSFDDVYYSDWLSRELKESKKAIEKETGKPVRFLAYPYGDYDSRVVRAAQESGYDLAVTAEFGMVHHDSDPFRLRRVVIDTSMSFGDFRRLMGNGSLKVEDPTPAAGSLFSPENPVIAAKVADYKSLEPSSVGIAVVGLGAVPSSFNPADGTISTVVRDPMPGNRQQVIVWGRDKKTGRRVESSWSFYASEIPQKVAAPAKAAAPTTAPPNKPSASNATTTHFAHNSTTAPAPRSDRRR
jgi:peptidoglycan/xylan/chitin deacetylase (PgdA/CDA1 family)